MNLDETSKSQDKTPKTKDKTTFNIDGQMGSPRNKDVGGHNLRLPLEEDAVSPVQHSEDIELPTTPRSKNSMDVDENTSDLSEFDEVPDDLVKVAQDLVTSKAEEHIAKIFNDRFAPQQAQIDQIREDVRQIGQLYNGPCLGDLEAVSSPHLVRNDLKLTSSSSRLLRGSLADIFSPIERKLFDAWQPIHTINKRSKFSSRSNKSWSSFLTGVSLIRWASFMGLTSPWTLLFFILDAMVRSAKEILLIVEY